MKVDRALIIRRDGVQLSIDYAQGCAESCEEHGVDYEFIKAVEFLSPEEAYKSVGAQKARNYNPSMGNACCHASMIKCWRRIVELNKPCLILEHDSLIVGDVTNIDIPDNALVWFGYRVWDKDQYKPPREAEKLIPVPKVMGAHAYAITPVTAKKLVDDAEKMVYKGVDNHLFMINSCKIPIYICEPPQAVCWVRKSSMPIVNDDTKHLKKSSGITRAFNRGVHQTKGWIEGQQGEYKGNCGTKGKRT